ncbi:MAG: hypothetical protein ACNI27_04755 [Desulfovibrio sp.]
MANTHLHDLQAYLRERAVEVREIEAKGQVVLHTENDQEMYNELMREKAQVLSGLLDGATEAAGEAVLADHPEIQARIAQFSKNAKNALGVGSVFYMSALLYPDDYKDGENNDLENFIDGL